MIRYAVGKAGDVFVCGVPILAGGILDAIPPFCGGKAQREADGVILFLPSFNVAVDASALSQDRVGYVGHQGEKVDVTNFDQGVDGGPDFEGGFVKETAFHLVGNGVPHEGLCQLGVPDFDLVVGLGFCVEHSVGALPHGDDFDRRRPISIVCHVRG